jgi:hypothetical protein
MQREFIGLLQEAFSIAEERDSTHAHKTLLINTANLSSPSHSESVRLNMANPTIPPLVNLSRAHSLSKRTTHKEKHRKQMHPERLG